MNKYESIYKKHFEPASLAVSRVALRNERPLDELFYKAVFFRHWAFSQTFAPVLCRNLYQGTSLDEAGISEKICPCYPYS